ncbi:MAG: TetR/AcrR family transcriptional regulator [Acidimicrobiia bacterium]|nr:TetR/AcrR family transcriptional regulator [Acidimicrobiia bacterium]
MPRIRAESIDEHKELTRRALLDSAREQIARAGGVEIALADVAIAAGVGRTTFYEYFSDRDDVVASLVEEELPVVLEGIIASVDPSLTVVERLGELAAGMVEFVADDPVLGVILHKEIGRMSPRSQERIALAHSQLSSEMTDLYRSGVAEGSFRPFPPGLAGMLIQDSIMAGARLIISSRSHRPDVAAITEAVKSFLLAGLGDR